MKDSVPPRDTAASDPTIARGASRRHLRLIQPPTPSPCIATSNAHESPTQRISHDVDPDDPPLTILAW
jgi:hypothetical protein